jgi:hypothetical protein
MSSLLTYRVLEALAATPGCTVEQLLGVLRADQARRQRRRPAGGSATTPHGAAADEQRLDRRLSRLALLDLAGERRELVREARAIWGKRK